MLITLSLKFKINRQLVVSTLHKASNECQTKSDYFHLPFGVSLFQIPVQGVTVSANLCDFVMTSQHLPKFKWGVRESGHCNPQLIFSSDGKTTLSRMWRLYLFLLLPFTHLSLSLKNTHGKFSLIWFLLKTSYVSCSYFDNFNLKVCQWT